VTGGTATELRPADPAARQPARILAVGNMYPPHHAGGYEICWQAAMRHARSLGHQVRVVTTSYRKDVDVPDDDPDVHRTLGWYWDLDAYEFPERSLAERLRLERRNASELRRHLREFRPDVVSWWSMGCMSLALIEQARRAGLPAVYVVHDDWLVYGPPRDQWIRIWRGWRNAVAPLVRRLSGVATHVDLGRAGPFVFNSEYTRRRALETAVRIGASTVVHPGIDERFLEPAPAQPWAWRLVYVGRLDRQKGIDTAISALALLGEGATLSVWGTGQDAYVAEMLELATRLGVADRVRFEGWAAGDGLRDVYANADVVVFPVRWEEPFGLVPLEAMGVGRPVVGTARGGSVEFMHDGENALVVPADDTAATAACVRRLAGDEALRARLIEAGRRTAAQYTLERFAQRTVAEILSVLPPQPLR
jgi:glycosyltransferase involved in cell wall biosynthesis